MADSKLVTITLEHADGAIKVERPATLTQHYKGTDVEIDLTRVTEAGLEALLVKSTRQVTDGSDDLDAVYRKVDQLYGLGKPIGSRVSRDPVAAELMVLVAKRAVASGIKTKEIPKFGKSVEDVTAVARGLGISASWLKKATKRCEQIAALKAEEI